MRSIHHIAASLSFLTWLAQASSAQAKTEQIIVDKDLKVARLTIRPGTLYPIKLDSPIKELGDPNHPYAQVIGNIGSKKMRIEIASNAPDFTFRPIVETEAEYTVIFVVRATTEEEPSEAANVVYRPPEELDERAAFLLDEMDPHHSQAIGDAHGCSGRGVRICGLKWTKTAGHGILRFMVANNTRSHLEPARLEVQPKLGGADHALVVKFGDRKPTSAQDLDARIRSMERVEAQVLIRDPGLLGNKVMLYLRGIGGVIAADYIDLRPPNDFGKIVLRLQSSIGAVWLPNPVDKEQFGAAMLTTLAMRATYAMNLQFRVEAELAGIRSTEARFRDILYNDTTGDMLRDTMGVRLLLGGNLRVGKRAKYAPFLRGGVGFQTVQQSVRFTSGQGTITGPGDGFAFDFLFWFGTGLDVQLSKHWNAGLGLAVGGAMNLASPGQRGTFEGTFHIGYGWGGYVRE